MPDGPGSQPSKETGTSGGASAALREWAKTRPARHRAIGAQRAAACRRLPKLVSKDVVERNGREIAAEMGVSFRTWQRWRAGVRSVPEADWPYVLMPGWSGRSTRFEIPEAAWEFFRGLYLTRRQPDLAGCWRRTCEAAAEHGWGELPSIRTFQSRVKTDISPQELTLKRHGPEALARLFPSQRRDKRMFLPGKAASGDGLKFDRLWVQFPDGEILNTTTAWFWQDLATNFIAAHRVAKTETTDLFRLATLDMCEVFVPDDVWIDNTMVAASKVMTGQQEGRRYRGKKTPLDPPGLLTQLGIRVHHTNPDPVMGNPGAKPIERSYGIGGIHEAVATHPRFRDRGHSRKTAIPFTEFAEVVAQEVERFNTRSGRRTPACGGKLSFRQVWERGFATSQPRVLTEEQRDLLLRIPETVLVDRRNGEIRLKAGRGPLGRRRYHAEDLLSWRGEHVVAWYDPEDFSAAVVVTTLEDVRHICRAECLEDVGFADQGAAREHAKQKRRFVTAAKTVAAAQERMTSAELAALYPAPKETPPPPEPGVVRGTFRRTAELRPPEAAAATGTDGAPSTLSAQIDSHRRRLEELLAAAAQAPATNEEWED